LVSFDELAIRWSPFFRDCIINELIVEKSYLLLIFITYGKNSLKIPKRHTSKDNQNDGQKKIIDPQNTTQTRLGNTNPIKIRG
jgi:hypothetical protein